jgi:molybdopterin molybdotransferase
METYENALKKLFNLEFKQDVEIVYTKNSLNRVLSKDVLLENNYPDTLKSAVDGYALRFHESEYYELMEEDVAAGKLHDLKLNKGEAIFIMTGGIVPESADAVVRVEDCECYGSHLFVKNKIDKNENINGIGEEAEKGYIIAEKGDLIKDTIFPTLFYGGVSKVEVYKKIKIGVLITGDEIIEVDDGFQKGQVFNTNKYIIESLLSDLPVEIFYENKIEDNEDDTFKTLEIMMDKYDVVVTSGGISMGKFDYVKKVFNEKKFNILINKTKIKPGSPLMVAEKKNVFFFGMPGYPAAFTTNLILYLKPFIKKICGFKNFENKFIKAKLKTSMKSRKGIDYFNRGFAIVDDGEYFVYDLNSQKTSHYLNFAKANCLVYLNEDLSKVAEGEYVKILPFCSFC